MATKKPITKKPAPKKKTTTAKKPAVKSTKKSAPSKVSGLKAHIGLRPEETDFFTFRITRQTLYWLVLGAVVILFTVWILQLQQDIQALYDQIDAATIEANSL